MKKIFLLYFPQRKNFIFTGEITAELIFHLLGDLLQKIIERRDKLVPGGFTAEIYFSFSGRFTAEKYYFFTGEFTAENYRTS